MKMPAVRTTSLSIAAVAVAFVCGMAIMSHQPTPVQLNGNYRTASTTAAAPTSTTTQVATTTGPSSSSTTVPQPPVAASSPSSTTNSSTNTPSTPATTQSDPTPPAVTAVSSDIQPWTDPVATTPQGGMPGSTTTVSYQYCLYTYSDGSTQQTVQRTRYQTTNPDGSAGGDVILIGGIDCTVNNAPAPR